ncbi:MAG TPA: beta-galactosidase [Candidatus Brocadiia bacterium]|nr:beta-galactosidase [Candidatus Brocadiia bacterium]
MKTLSVSLSILAAMFFASANLFADRLDEEHTMTMQFQTPHTRWANPFARGPARMLFFTNGRSTLPREIVELKQRFEVEAEAAFHIRVVDTTLDQWHGAEAGVERIDRLLGMKFDCYVFFGVAPALLTEQQQARVLKAVREGGGIVLAGAGDDAALKDSSRVSPLPPFLASGSPLDALPFCADAGKELPADQRTEAAVTDLMITAHKLGEGRAVKLPMRPQLPYQVGWDVQYEYWQQLFGKAILWAAGKTPDVELALSLEKKSFAWEEIPGQASQVKLAWKVANPEAGINELVFEASVRSFTGEIVPLGKATAAVAPAAEPAPAEWRLPELPAGAHFVDVRATSRRGVEAFASAGFAVTVPRRIAAIELLEPYSEVGGACSGTVKLEGAEAVATERVQVRVCDWRNRILVQADFKPTSSEVVFNFTVRDWWPMLARVEAVVLNAGREVTRSSVLFNVAKRNRGQFNFLIWDYPRDTLSIYAEQSMAQLGTTLQLGQGTPPPEAAAMGIACVPYTTRILAPLNEKFEMQPVCWSDQRAARDYVKGIVDNQAGPRRHGVFAYSLGDETVTRGACLSFDCLDAYREYLKQEYGTIDALNKSWNAKYADWKEIDMPEGDNDAKAAKDAKNYAQWYDRQAFKCANFVQFCGRFKAAFKKLDSEARTGFEGAGRLCDGDDFDLIARNNDFWTTYPGPGDEIIRSIAPRDFPRSNWMGYVKDENELIRQYWRMVTRGCDAVWWWRWDNVGRFIGFLHPDLGPYPQIRKLVDETEVVRNGLGSLLIRSRMQDDGIVMLYSHPSVYAAGLENGPSFGMIEKTHETWHRMLRDAGLQFRYVTDRALRLGEFKPDGVRMMILSRAEAIGPKEAEVIRNFVREGGVLVADVRPGVYDGHCKPLASGHLDDVFGIRRTGAADAMAGAAVISSDVTGETMTIEGVEVDPCVEPVGAQSLGSCKGKRVLMVNQFGSGMAILLNFRFDEFVPLILKGEPNAAQRLVSAFFGVAGLYPAIGVARTDDNPLRNVEVTRWKNGDIDIVSFFNENPDEIEVSVRPPQRAYVGDLRRSMEIGQCSEFIATLPGRRATFYAFSKTPFIQPKLDLPQEVISRGQQLTINVSYPDAQGFHAAMVRVYHPDKTLAEWHNNVMITDKGNAICTIPIAYNDPAGQWAVKVVDLYSSRATRVFFDVK